MTDPISAFKAAYETGKLLYDLQSKIKNAEAKRLIADLNISLAEAKAQIANLINANSDLQGQIQTLKRKREEQPEFRDGKYFIRAPGPNQNMGPHCVACFHTNGTLIPLHKTVSGAEVFGEWECPVCNKTFP